MDLLDRNGISAESGVSCWRTERAMDGEWAARTLTQWTKCNSRGCHFTFVLCESVRPVNGPARARNRCYFRTSPGAPAGSRRGTPGHNSRSNLEFATNMLISAVASPSSRFYEFRWVRQECGAHSIVDGGTGVATPAPQGGARRGLFRAPPPDTELLQFAAQLAANKRLFAGLSDRLCDEPELAHADNARCWTGEGVGEYTKPLVTSNSLSDQRYNPEVSDVTPLPRVAALADQLRHARQVLVSHKWSSSPTAEAFMQGDEAEAEHDMGSGSGRSLDDSPDYDADGSGDGSGHGPDNTLNKGAIEEVPTEKPSAAVSLLPSACFAFISTILLLYLT